MIKIDWNNRFLMGLLALLVVFIIVVGWIIVRETTASSAVAYRTSTPSASSANRPASSSLGYSPSRAPESAKQMYVHMQETATSDKVTPETGADQNYNAGYQWATAQQISRSDQCKQLQAEYQSGCRAYLEVKHYISQTDRSFGAPRD